MQSVAQFPYRDALHHETKRDDQGCGLQWRENMKPDGGGNQAEGKAGQPRHQCRSKSRREKIAMLRTLASIDRPHVLVSDFAAAGLKQIYVVRIFSGCGNPQRYFVIAFNFSTGPPCSRAKGPTVCSRQFSIWSWINVFLACAMAFSRPRAIAGRRRGMAAAFRSYR